MVVRIMLDCRKIGLELANFVCMHADDSTRGFELSAEVQLVPGSISWMGDLDQFGPTTWKNIKEKLIDVEKGESIKVTGTAWGTVYSDVAENRLEKRLLEAIKCFSLVFSVQEELR